MDEVQELEPVQDLDESQEELAVDMWGERVDSLFGEPSIPPSFYHCVQCGNDILAQEVLWDREDRPHCPQCKSLLKRGSGPGTTTAIG